MTDHLRWGILGAAQFAQNHMGPAIHMARRGRLAALATSSADKAAPFAAFAPGLQVFDSYEALLADPDIDAVYIPLPNHLHVEWAVKALEAGKHVLVEKPLAMQADGFDPVIRARDASGKLAAEAYMIVHHPQWQRARALVSEGAIGKLVRVSAAFSFDNRDGDNIRNRPETGGGAIPDIGVYIYGATRFVTGEEPEAILSTEIRRENDVDVWSHVTARFPSFHYTGVVSMRMAPWQEVVFHGEGGVLRLTTPFNAQVYGEARVELQAADLTVTSWRFPSVNHYVQQVENFNASVLDGAAYPCPLEFSRGTQEMIDMVWAKDAG
ncbi:Gfo/Idh/MocA family protein [Pseudoponticoccus marisrubri]|uniref:Oxidoreductase n=1 Tax=Pseudoponticoccus marisrubri TaxID=1685382 RepID=A0A0W7WKR1_9RHOB|nr:Gfo/Idh/MocA family oxidoreductase [Pseudoponticoccus marisrubri]KUF11197.1 oxidoreductase [Pseudoponticoccus marisrubri]